MKIIITEQCEISSSHGGEYDVQKTSVDNHFTRQYNPEDSSEHYRTDLSLELQIIKVFEISR
jgi:hypothetical protein